MFWKILPQAMSQFLLFSSSEMLRVFEWSPDFSRHNFTHYVTKTSGKPILPLQQDFYSLAFQRWFQASLSCTFHHFFSLYWSRGKSPLFWQILIALSLMTKHICWEHWEKSNETSRHTKDNFLWHLWIAERVVKVHNWRVKS